MQCMDAVLAPIRLRGRRVLNYSDNWLVCATSVEQYRSHVAGYGVVPESEKEQAAAFNSHNISGHIPGLHQGLHVPHCGARAGLQGVPKPIQVTLTG